jgi:Protein of unknown function (DUF3579)
VPSTGSLRLSSTGSTRVATALPMTSSKPRLVFIRGVTKEGKTFRPSDWAERLAGAMSSFRPGGSHGGISAYIGYSPYCVPRVVDGVKCVIVNEALRDIEPMAWDFVINFGKDNDLQVAEGTLTPDGPELDGPPGPKPERP